ncbi:copper homeostasis protein CutC [Streptomyces carminius]|uniref:Copper homeostasis protein cutC homolog n=1 Tax=Streptomyces carminius TaxID=2665496 RepID=A0A2M8M072_9ACTN|nr:copper homeostasis protein CutC [Streptomyces carminius]PJE97579.1 copper homeostasis protein CutC [Streptomyces carminius]
MLARPLLEVIALDARDASAAQDGGADRLELVADMTRDGLTPARETFAAVRAAVRIPVRVMLRDTDGFAAGGPAALDALCERARALRAEGAEEFVLGFLDDTGAPDLAAITALLAAVPGGRWTFHRALDHATDRDGLRKRLDGLPGLDACLTAGSADGVAAGLETLCAEAARAAAGDPGHRPLLMAGGGLTADHVPALRAAGVRAFHIGGAARTGGWDTPVSADAVRAWRALLDG